MRGTIFERQNENHRAKRIDFAYRNLQIEFFLDFH